MKIKSDQTRAAQIEALKPGESAVFFPGRNPSYASLQSSVTAAISNAGLVSAQFSQRKALLVVEGELPVPVSILTRDM